MNKINSIKRVVIVPTSKAITQVKDTTTVVLLIVIDLPYQIKGVNIPVNTSTP